MAQTTVCFHICITATAPLIPQSDDTLALLTRLSQKSGVQSTLVLSRDTGAIIRTSGLISDSSSTNTIEKEGLSSKDGAEVLSNGARRQATGMHSAEDVARLVYSFVTAAGSMIKELDEGDEAKLLRVRTKKNELVIVPGTISKRANCVYSRAHDQPDAKFLLVAIHDTPPV